MATIQLPYLEETITVEQGDLLLARKSGETADKKIKFSNLCKSIGNSSILGYKATVINTTNTIITLNLTPLNNVPIPYTIVSTNKYPDFPSDTLIFFTFPKDFKGKIEANILDKTYNINVSSDNSSYFSCREGDYFIIKYVPTQSANNIFVRINDYDHIISSNIYNVTEVKKESTKVTLKLSSSGGIQKQKYFSGMEIYFVSTETIVSNDINVIIDDLLALNKQSLKFEDATLKTTIVAGREVRAVYDGSNFIIKSQDYPQLLPDFLFNGYDDNYLIDFYNTYYSNIKTINYTFSVDKNGNADYLSIHEAIQDIEQKLGINKHNVKVTLKIGDIEISQTTVIERDLSYIEISTLNTEINIDCNAYTAAFIIVKNGVFFSVAKNTIFNVSSSRNDTTLTGCNFIHIHNNVHNSFEDFSIVFKDFTSSRTIYTVFSVVYAGGGLSMKNVTIKDFSTGSVVKKYYHGINLGIYSSNIYLNNIVIKNRIFNGHALLIGGVTWQNDKTIYTPYKHNVFVINCDFSSDNTLGIQTSDIFFLNPDTYKGYTILNQIDTKGGCNVVANTSSPRWGWYTREGDGTTQGTN